MKRILILLTLLVSFTCLNAQDHFIPKDKWSDKFYISDDYAKSKGLKLVETNELLKAWNAEEDTATVFRVVDICFWFKDAAEAKKYLEDNIKELSEEGDAIKETIKIDKAGNIKCYTENEAMRQMNKAFGIDSYMYFYLFTIDNYVAKVFVNTTKQISANDAADFAREAAKRLDAAK